MSKDKKTYLTDSCPMCKRPVKVRPVSAIWEIKCVRCHVTARADDELRVLDNWIKFRVGMENVKIKKK